MLISFVFRKIYYLLSIYHFKNNYYLVLPRIVSTSLYYMFIQITNCYCAGRNCVNNLQRNQPADYKSAIGTVNQESDLLSCEISLRVYVLIWRRNCLSLCAISSSNQRITLLWHLCILSTYARSSCWEGRNENLYNVIILNTSLSLTSPVQGAMATADSILDLAGQA